MEPVDSKLVWNKSVEKTQTLFTTFIGDCEGFQQVCEIDPYFGVTIHKEGFLAHESKRLKKTLCKRKKNTKSQTYIQH